MLQQEASSSTQAAREAEQIPLQVSLPWLQADRSLGSRVISAAHIPTAAQPAACIPRRPASTSVVAICSARLRRAFTGYITSGAGPSAARSSANRASRS